MKADLEAEYEERKKAIYEVLKQMRVYRGNDGATHEDFQMGEDRNTIDETSE